MCITAQSQDKAGQAGAHGTQSCAPNSNSQTSVPWCIYYAKLLYIDF